MSQSNRHVKDLKIQQGQLPTINAKASSVGEEDAGEERFQVDGETPALQPVSMFLMDQPLPFQWRNARETSWSSRETSYPLGHQPNLALPSHVPGPAAVQSVRREASQAAWPAWPATTGVRAALPAANPEAAVGAAVLA